MAWERAGKSELYGCNHGRGQDDLSISPIVKWASYNSVSQFFRSEQDGLSAGIDHAA
jgi:hypothetical protein